MAKVNFVPRSQKQVDNLKNILSSIRQQIEDGGNTFEGSIKGWKQRTVREAAQLSDVSLSRMGFAQPDRYLLRSPSTRALVQNSRSHHISRTVEHISNDKYLAKLLLQEHKVPVAIGKEVQTFEEAKEAFLEIGDCVVKPVFGSLYQGVTIGIDSEEKLEQAWKYVRETDPKGPILVEEYIKGADLRVHVANGKFVVAYLRMPANVMGDGVHTIREIVDQKNKKRNTLPGVRGKEIKFDDTILHYLKCDNLTPETILPKGKPAVLSYNPNIYGGADWFNISDIVHPTIKKISEDAVRSVGDSGFFGLDLLCENPQKPIDEARTIICEVNSRPNVTFFQHLTYTKPRKNVADVFQSAVSTEKAPKISWSKWKKQYFLEGKLGVGFKKYVDSTQEISIESLKDIENTGNQIAQISIECDEKEALSVFLALLDFNQNHSEFVTSCFFDQQIDWKWDDILRDTYDKPAQIAERGISNAQALTAHFNDTGFDASLLDGGLIQIKIDGKNFLTSAGGSSTVTSGALTLNSRFDLRRLQMFDGLRVVNLMASKNSASFLNVFDSVPTTTKNVLFIAKGLRPKQFRTDSKQFFQKHARNVEKVESVCMVQPVDLKNEIKLKLAVVNGIVGGAVLEVPLYIVGDGIQDIQQLLSQRIQQFRLTTRALEQALVAISRNYNRNKDYVVPRNKVIYCSISPSSFGIQLSTIKQFLNTAIKASQSLPGLRLSEVVFEPSSMSGEDWRISSVQGVKDLTIYAQPDFGTKSNIFDTIWNEHCLKFELKEIPITLKSSN